MRLVLTSILLFFFSSGALTFELVPHTATYTANIKKGVKIKGKAVRELKQLQNDRWVYSFNVESFVADINESSTFSLLENSLIPSGYNYKLSPMLGRTKNSSVGFDWQSGIVHGSYKKKSWLFQNIPNNTYDTLSYQLQLLMDIDNNKNDLTYTIANRAKLKPSTFEVIGKEVLETSLGQASTLVAKKVRSNDSKRETYLWISEKYPMLLVKMTQTEKDGEEYEIHLESGVVNGQAINFDNLGHSEE